jgi:hypothetical protein
MQFAIVSNSAWSTLLICDRQARRDTGKVLAAIAWTVEILTCQQAIQTYRAIWRLMQIVWSIAVLLFLLLHKQVDRAVAECEAPAPIAAVEPAVQEPEVVAAETVEPIAQEPEAAIVETAEFVGEADVAPIVSEANPQPVGDSQNWDALDPFQLRKACAQQGIKWRNARLDGKHLRKDEMVAALVASGIVNV